MKIEQIKLYKIKGNPDNPRVIKNDKFNALVKSIKEFPEMLKIRPIVVDENMMVLGGNMRLKACAEAGIKDGYIIKASELTDEQKKEFIVKDNVNFGGWDWDTLANEWDSVKLTDWGLDVWDGDPEAPPAPSAGVEPNFDDEGVLPQDQYGVIVMCKDAAHQEKVYNSLIGSGYECKVVVT